MICPLGLLEAARAEILPFRSSVKCLDDDRLDSGYCNLGLTSVRCWYGRLLASTCYAFAHETYIKLGNMEMELF